MGKPKFDGVIEAVRYDSDGKISQVRGYLRHAETFSDRIIWRREKLEQFLLEKKKFVTGNRKLMMGGTFEEHQVIQHLKNNNQEIIITTNKTDHDDLHNTPLF
ncbi:MAG: hypothetical protein JEZ06_03105 [Anaerolineaceae bacterium]|nr:hypothetical protein [Anaerolineaceae bacterium]